MTIRKAIYLMTLTALCTLAISCGDSENNGQGEDLRLYGAETQTLSVKVESVGEAQPISGRAANESFINSITPIQTINKVVVVIVNGHDGQVVAKKTIMGWSDTNNQASHPYYEGDKRGRMTDITLRGDERLKTGMEYIVYAVGCHEGTYGGYEPFGNIEPGDRLNRTETASKPDGELAAELFAGAQTVVNENGKLVNKSKSPDESGAAIVTLRRQVGGTFGYFTHIPTQVNGVPVASVRMASPKAYKTVIMAGFRSQEDPDDFNVERVVNGSNERTVYDAAMHGQTADEAFMIYRIDLKNWFPGNTTDPELPYDKNGDGYLDGADTNWQLSDYLKDTGLKVERGAVYGSRYLIATEMTAEDVARGLATFELQLLDKDGHILKYWPVEMRDEERLTLPRSVVTLAEDGKTVNITRLTTPESSLTYSIMRNNLYTLGEKNSSQTYGEDSPIRLADEEVLVMDVNPEWQAFDAIIFN